MPVRWLLRRDKDGIVHKIFVAHSWKLLTDHVPNGDGLFAWGLLHRLALRGHELHVACRAVDLRSPVPARMQLHPLTADQDHLGVATRVQYMRRVRPLFRRLQASVGFDLVHQANPVDAGVSLALPADVAPLVLGPYWADWPTHRAGDVRDRMADEAGVLSRRLVRGIEQRRAAAVLVTTDAARAKVHARADVPVRLVPPGIDLARFSEPPAAPGGRPPTVLFLANLRAHKGIFTLLDAFDLVTRRMPEARLLVAGGGPDAAAVAERVAASPAGANVELLGPVAPSDVPDVMARADVFCQPGHGEPFGWSAVEAMACRLPVVVTRAGGLDSVVPDDAGHKVPPGEAAPLADALIAVLSDRASRRRMGEAGRRAVEATYDWERVIDRLESVYDEAVARS